MSSTTDAGQLVLTESAVRAMDPSGMYEHVRLFPSQWKAGHAQAQAITLDLAPKDIDHLVLVGMGGSAIAGDLLGALARDQSPVSVSVSRSYTLPAFVDERTLVVVSSYSGNTEETLAGMKEALRRKAHLFCITSNGAVRQRAENENIPYHLLPGGLPPRAALGYSWTAVLHVAIAAGLLPDAPQMWEESQQLLESMAEELSDFSGNQALTIAQELEDRLPLVYSSGGLLEPVNLRWRNQLQENAKKMAYGNVYPELNHNEIMGWVGNEWLLSQLAVISLRDKEDHPRVERRMNVTGELLQEKAGYWLELSTRGEHPLTRLLSLIYLGDWVSFYVAVLTGQDPTPVGLISTLKKRLAS